MTTFNKNAFAFGVGVALAMDALGVVNVSAKPGDKVVHTELGPATVVKVDRKTGAITIRLADGTMGTTSVRSLRRA